MKETNNVVSLSGLQPQTRRSQSRRTDLPVAVEAVRARAVAYLAEQTKQVFAKVDDSLFSMAEKAHGQGEQDGLFQALRLLRVERRNLVERFSENVSLAFQDIRRNTDQSEDLYSADSLSLVHNDDLEQLVAVDTMVAAARRNFAEPLTEISLRLNTLLPVKIYDKNNPLGPDAICDAFVEAVRNLDLHIRARLTLLKKFEQQVMVNLNALYDQCNELFVEQGVLPSLRQQRRAARQAQPQSRPQTSPQPAPQGQQGAQAPVTHSGAAATGAPVQGGYAAQGGHGLLP